MGEEIADYVDKPQTSADFEMKIAASKINKMIVKKLVHTHTKRLLRIIGYQTNENDSKRLEYAVT